MWIITITILFLLEQNCLTTKLIDLPDSEEYEDGVKSFLKDIKRSTTGHPLAKEKASRDSKDIKRNSPGHLRQSNAEKASYSKEIERRSIKYPQDQTFAERTSDYKEKERSNPDLFRQSPEEKTLDSQHISKSFAEKSGVSKEIESSRNKLLLSNAELTLTRRLSAIEPQITLSRESNEKKPHSHHHHSDSEFSSSRERFSEEIASRSFHNPTIYKQSPRERTSHHVERKSVRRSNDADKYDNEKDENIKKKLTSLVEQTLHDTEKKIESIQGIKTANRDLPPYKIGFILSMVKKSRDMLNELFNTAVKHRDSWRALEQLKIFELIAHTNVDTTNLVRQLVEIHIQYINSTMGHTDSSNSPPAPHPEGDRKRVLLL